jgi:glycerol-3-phosphate dehydrogenase
MLSDKAITSPVDLVIIGGGINGCGCAADAAMRGLSVLLCEKNDLAAHTSSSSSKLIHGGLRYLEQFNFSLVRQSLNERQKLLKLAPHLVHHLPFVLPQNKSSRQSWLLRLGLFLYDHLSLKNRLPNYTALTRRNDPTYFKPLKQAFTHGLMYYDCATDDARLTITNALLAKQHGANILPQTEVIAGEIKDDLWHLTIQTRHKAPQHIQAKAIINATGPWVESVNQLLHIPNQYRLALVKGSHIVLPALYEGNHAYVLQHTDKRIVFTIPYLGRTLVGTTDVAFSGDPNSLHISPEEVDYLLTLIGLYFNQKPTADDILTSWSGVRALVADDKKLPQTLSRDSIYHFSEAPAPCVTIYSGKITTYRILAEKVINQFSQHFPHLKSSLTDSTPLPGALLGSQSFETYAKNAPSVYAWLDKAILNHYLQTYGTRTDLILQNCHHSDDLGHHFSDVLYQREVDYLLQEEWASSAEDVLWRRTKLGLEMDASACKALERYIMDVAGIRT